MHSKQQIFMHCLWYICYQIFSLYRNFVANTFLSFIWVQLAIFTIVNLTVFMFSATLLLQWCN